MFPFLPGDIRGITTIIPAPGGRNWWAFGSTAIRCDLWTVMAARPAELMFEISHLPQEEVHFSNEKCVTTWKFNIVFQKMNIWFRWFSSGDIFRGELLGGGVKTWVVSINLCLFSWWFFRDSIPRDSSPWNSPPHLGNTFYFFQPPNKQI